VAGPVRGLAPVGLSWGGREEAGGSPARLERAQRGSPGRVPLSEADRSRCPAGGVSGAAASAVLRSQAGSRGASRPCRPGRRGAPAGSVPARTRCAPVGSCGPSLFSAASVWSRALPARCLGLVCLWQACLLPLIPASETLASASSAALGVVALPAPVAVSLCQLCVVCGINSPPE